MKSYELKWWFWIPVGIFTVGSTFWLFSALGLEPPMKPVTLPRVVLFLILVHSFRQLYSHLLWLALRWFAPAAICEKKVAS